jgi:hypothetical protein
MMAKRKKQTPEAALAAAEKRRIAESMHSLARERDFWRAAAIVAGALILVWLWTKLKF